MAVRTREEILESIRSRIGEDTSDESISLLEDITDTMAVSYTHLDVYKRQLSRWAGASFFFRKV